MFERLEAIKVRYEQLTEELSKPEVLGDYNQLKKLSKEQKDLEETYIKYKEYQKVINNIEEAKMLINDPEMGEMAALELEEATAKKESLIGELEILLIPKDENDEEIIKTIVNANCDRIQTTREPNDNEISILNEIYNNLKFYIR